MKKNSCETLCTIQTGSLQFFSKGRADSTQILPTSATGAIRPNRPNFYLLGKSRGISDAILYLFKHRV
jgi:hypothetical protein